MSPAPERVGPSTTRASAAASPTGDPSVRHLHRRPRAQGSVYLFGETTLSAFVDSTHPHFVPLIDVTVRSAVRPADRDRVPVRPRQPGPDDRGGRARRRRHQAAVGLVAPARRGHTSRDGTAAVLSGGPGGVVAPRILIVDDDPNLLDPARRPARVPTATTRSPRATASRPSSDSRPRGRTCSSST